jgi:hypothetical protein
MDDQSEVGDVLKENLEAARLAVRSAATEFRAIIADIPSGLPNPDGNLRIHHAGATCESALETYRVALEEFNDHFAYGAIPDRFKRPK